MIQTKIPHLTQISPNFTAERSGRLPIAVVVHKGEGSLSAIIDWFLRPVSQVSSHYVIALTGEITQMVSEGDQAWHAGILIHPTWPLLETGVNPNRTTIGVELEGYAAGNTPLVQQVSLCELLADIYHRYGIIPTAETLVFHRELNGSKTCPGYNITKEVLLSVIKIVMADNSPQVETSVNSNDHSGTFNCA